MMTLPFRMRLRQFCRDTSGFSILEMTIVLVIVGMLIGLALKGQDLLASVQLKDAQQDLRAFETAFATFRERYQALPGDFASASRRLPARDGIPIVNGNGNGRIETPAEQVQFWQHLALSGVVKKIRIEQNARARIGETLPAARIGGGYTVVEEKVYASRRLWIRLAATAEPRLDDASGVLTPAAAYQVDNELDDGNPKTGKIVAQGPGCVDQNDYRPDDEEKTCVLYMALR